MLGVAGFATQARMAMFLAGFPETTPITTVNRQCSSGLQAVANIAAAIRSGQYEMGIAAGVESMSTGGRLSRIAWVVLCSIRCAECLCSKRIVQHGFLR